jgi:hypothetical protein
MSRLKVYSLYFNQSEEEPTLCVWWVKQRNRERKPSSRFPLTGDLLLLVKAYLRRVGTEYEEAPLPIGIWLDRLQEEPTELVGSTPEEVAAILTELRRRSPNGV